MPDVLIRNVPDEVLERLKGQSGSKSLQEYLLYVLQTMAGSSYVPSRWGEGYRAFTPTGGKCTMTRGDNYVSGGASNLSQAEMDAYQKAKMLADPKNGGRWVEAREVLESAGFEVWNV